MKFDECVAAATNASDVKGIPRRVGKIVRRKLPAGYTKILKSKKKKKKGIEEIDVVTGSAKTKI